MPWAPARAAASKHWGVAVRSAFRVPRTGRLRDAARRRSVCSRSGRYDGVATLGAMIRGDTPHFDFVAGECARGLIGRAAGGSGKPVGFGVLTTNTGRAGLGARAEKGPSNKGYEATAYNAGNDPFRKGDSG